MEQLTDCLTIVRRELTPAVTVLQLFLSSSKPVLRFTAVRTLNQVAMTHPMAVTNCNIDMESLISDSNRSIATLAITTLLKTGPFPPVKPSVDGSVSSACARFLRALTCALRSPHVPLELSWDDDTT